MADPRITDRGLGKQGPIDPQTPHRKALCGEPARSGPSDTQSESAHRNAHLKASRKQLLLPSRNSDTALSAWPQGRALSRPATCSEPPDTSRKIGRAHV